MNPEEEFKILDWDSNFFGFKVAALLKERYGGISLSLILNHLKNNEYRLVYWASDSNDKESQDAAKEYGGFLADKKTTFTQELDKLEIESDPDIKSIVEYSHKHPSPELINLGILSGEFSRFRVDNNIPADKFAGLYKLWITNSVNKNFADSVFVKYYENKVSAMVTVQKKIDTGIIGLIAVDKILQGKKMGTALVYKALEWSKEKGCKTAKVVTQLDNKPACRLYEKCGYRIEKIENFYHFWL